MLYLSTRGHPERRRFCEILLEGLAPDGGLYVPELLPPARELQAGTTLADTAADLLAPFFAGDALEAALPAI